MTDSVSTRSSSAGWRCQAGKVVLDFTGDTFMDSSALNVLVATARQGPDDDAVAIRNAPFSVNRLLTITGLDEVIRIDGDPIDSRRAAS